MPTGIARSTQAPASACASTTSNSLAGRPPLGGLGIASYPGTLGHHRARNIEAAIQLIIDNFRRVAHPGGMIGFAARTSIELEDESQSVIEREQLLVGHPSNEVAEPFRRDGRRLFDQDLGLFIVDRDRRTKDTWRCGP